MSRPALKIPGRLAVRIIARTSSSFSKVSMASSSSARKDFDKALIGGAFILTMATSSFSGWISVMIELAARFEKEDTVGLRNRRNMIEVFFN